MTAPKVIFLCLNCGLEYIGKSWDDGRRCKKCKGAIVPIGEVSDKKPSNKGGEID